MSEKPIVDVSKWQGDIDYPTLINKTSGVVIRASASLYADSRFVQNYDGLQAHPGELGAYHFLYSNRSASAQAETFLDVVGNRLFDFLVIDVEDNAVGFTKSQMAAHVKTWIDHVRAARPGDEIRIYTRGEWWDWNIGKAGWEQDYRLWVAHYGTMNPRVPLAWNGVWTMHQYSADGNGLGAEYGVSSSSIDLNRMNPEYYPPPEPPPGATPERGETTARVNLRGYPGSHLVTTLNAGTGLDLLDEWQNVAGYDWWLVRTDAGFAGWVAKPWVRAIG